MVKPFRQPPDRFPFAFSSYSQSKFFDFSKNTVRDDVSFYKKLARFDKSNKLGITEEQYEALLRKHKSGKYIIKFDMEAAELHRQQ